MLKNECKLTPKDKGFKNDIVIIQYIDSSSFRDTQIQK